MYKFAPMIVDSFVKEMVFFYCIQRETKVHDNCSNTLGQDTLMCVRYSQHHTYKHKIIVTTLFVRICKPQQQKNIHVASFTSSDNINQYLMRDMDY